MIQLSFQELLDQWADVESAVDATDGIDQWCSGLDWVIPVATGFAPRGKRLFFKSAHGNGYAILGYYRRDDLIFLSSIEPLWGFASPIFGSDLESLSTELCEALDELDGWSILILPGLPPHPHPLTKAITKALQPLGVSIYTEGITRRVADLTGGYDEWLAARTSRFRRNLRQAESRGRRAGLSILDVSNDDNLFDRMLEIERRSWKGEDGSGITTPEMSAMYRTMIDRLSERDRLQAFVAQLPADQKETPGAVIQRDVGYILGGIRQRRYRGLQISFVDQHRGLSIGNLLQHHQIRHLINNDLADHYDMGMDFDYKQRWADHGETSITLVLHRSSGDQAVS